MRVVIPIVLGALAAFLLVHHFPVAEVIHGGPSIAPAPAPVSVDLPVVADVLEVRDASLFAGACHLASECDSQGRDALLAVTVDAGTHEGVDLAGTRVLVAVSAKGNLSTDARRWSELWVDGSETQAHAVAGWLATERPAAVGEVLAMHTADILVENCGPNTRVHVPGVARIEVEAITDGSCCSMPESRLYEPLVTAFDETVVGYASTCTFEGTEALQRWCYSDANNAHIGRIEEVLSCDSPCATSCAELPTP